MNEEEFYIEQLNIDKDSLTENILDYDDYPEYETEYTTDW
jgi:hypothetical protein